MGLILDTNFVITAEREAKRRVPGKADAFLAAPPEELFFITFAVAGELACGQSAAARAQWERLCLHYSILPWTVEICWQYGELYRLLARKGTLIGTTTSGSRPPRWCTACAGHREHGGVRARARAGGHRILSVITIRNGKLSLRLRHGPSGQPFF